MARIVITHVGTSTLSCDAMNPKDARVQPILDKAQKAWEDWWKGRQSEDTIATPPFVEDDADPRGEWSKKCAEYLAQGLKHVWEEYDRNTSSDSIQRRKQSPAEIASLILLNQTPDGQIVPFNQRPDDRVVLLHSDTADGSFAAWLLNNVLTRNILPGTDYPYCPAAQIERVVVSGLRVSDDSQTSDTTEERTDKETFVREGLVSYVEKVWEQFRNLNELGGGELIFNITGGYKGMIPIARDLALLLEAYHREQQKQKRPAITCELCYLYVSSSDLIEYGALPVRFDSGVITPELKGKLREAGMQPGIPSTELTDLDGQMIAKFKPFFTASSQHYYTRSPLGEVVWAIWQRVDFGRVTVSFGPAH